MRVELEFSHQKAPPFICHAMVQDWEDPVQRQVRAGLRRAILPYLVLDVVSSRPAYAYDVARRLQRSAPTVCRSCDLTALFRRLEQAGLISLVSERTVRGRSRRYYGITEEGSEALETFRHEFFVWERVILMIGRAGAEPTDRWFSYPECMP